MEVQKHFNRHKLTGRILRIIKAKSVYSVYMQTTHSRDGKSTNDVRVVAFPPMFSEVDKFKKGDLVTINGYTTRNPKEDRMSQNIIMNSIEKAKSKLEELGLTKNAKMVVRENEGIYVGIVNTITVSKRNNMGYVFLSILNDGHQSEVCVRFFMLPQNKSFFDKVKKGDNVAISATMQSKEKVVETDKGERKINYENLVGMEAVIL